LQRKLRIWNKRLEKKAVGIILTSCQLVKLSHPNMEGSGGYVRQRVYAQGIPEASIRKSARQKNISVKMVNDIIGSSSGKKAVQV